MNRREWLMETSLAAWECSRPVWTRFHYAQIRRTSSLGQEIVGPRFALDLQFGCPAKEPQMVFSTQATLHAKAPLALGFIQRVFGFARDSEWTAQENGFAGFLRSFLSPTCNGKAWMSLYPWRERCTDATSHEQSAWKTLWVTGERARYQKRLKEIVFECGVLPVNAEGFRFGYRADAPRKSTPRYLRFCHARRLQRPQGVPEDADGIVYCLAVPKDDRSLLTSGFVPADLLNYKPDMGVMVSPRIVLSKLTSGYVTHCNISLQPGSAHTNQISVARSTLSAYLAMYPGDAIIFRDLGIVKDDD